MKRLNGKNIVDATEPLAIRVTRKDVNVAKAKSPTTCALAKGCLHDSKVLSARIGVKVALIELDGEIKRYGVLPEDARKIRAFDNAHYFQPGTYTLVPPKTKLGVHTRGHGRKGDGKPHKDVYRQAPLRHIQRVDAV